MKKFSASFLGRDCPGVVATISKLLYDAGCSIMSATQSILYGEFAGIFLVHAPDTTSTETIRETLVLGLKKAQIDMSLIVRPAIEGQWGDGLHCEPFVVSADGSDAPGEIAAMSRVFARHGVNIESLRAFSDEGGAGRALFVFEIMVPDTIDLGRLRRELVCEGQNLNLRVSVQHRDIFEAVHRIGAC